jgi:hypothetical protein
MHLLYCAVSRLSASRTPALAPKAITVLFRLSLQIRHAPRNLRPYIPARYIHIQMIVKPAHNPAAHNHNCELPGRRHMAYIRIHIRTHQPAARSKLQRKE